MVGIKWVGRNPFLYKGNPEHIVPPLKSNQLNQLTPGLSTSHKRSVPPVKIKPFSQLVFA